VSVIHCPGSRTAGSLKGMTAANDMSGNTAPFSAARHPALSLPRGEADGRPIGLMLVGRPFGEATVLRAARACELAAG
jgi:amidase